ncbi:DNA polymerase [Proboscivirus elephantidbeta4]|uniref:DNA polymerase n=9 Tax=Elephant endotheliotropic herpesvirus 4 TaxID=548914 RepID=A0A0S1TRU2_9BETA|nr:DNA polymerase [Elephant endotheliotropic herpesvirus 4]ALM25982.1 DNA polymerase [Elephant endotheliotropic herpesvirus 4]
MSFYNPYFKRKSTNGGDSSNRCNTTTSTTTGSSNNHKKNDADPFLSVIPECVVKPKSARLLKKYNGSQPRIFYRGEPLLLSELKSVSQWPVKNIEATPTQKDPPPPPVAIKKEDPDESAAQSDPGCVLNVIKPEPVELSASSSDWFETPAFTGDTSYLTFHVYEQTVFCGHDVAYGFLPYRYRKYMCPTGAVVCMFGKTEDGTDVCVNVHGQSYYFYVDVKGRNKEDTRETVDTIMANLEKQASSCICTIKEVQRTSLLGFTRKTETYMMLNFTNPFVGKEVARSMRELDYQVFESTVEPNTRLIVDNRFSSFGWYRIRSPYVRHGNKDSNCALELDCGVSELEYLPDRVDWPNYKCLSFDIECLSGASDDAFPDAANPDDLIIQISCVCFDVNQTRETRHLFTLGPCDPIPGVHIYECASEYELILGFLTFLRAYGPNFLTGYNINSFDIPYVVGRCRFYNLQCGVFTKLRRGRFSYFKGSESFLNRSTNKVTVSGVVVVDMYKVCMDKVSAPNHKLDTVVAVLLGERKQDVSYKQIPVLFRRDEAGRAVVGAYCVHDSVLVRGIFCKLLYHYEVSAIARLSGISMNRVIFDGQQIRIFTSMLAAARRENLIIPTPNDSAEDNTYQGATVLAPKTSFYNTPVAVLDFASLYPSIIQAYNLCYSTLVLDEEALAGVPEDDVISVSASTGRVHRFVKAHVRRSVLAQLLTAWLAERRAVREKLKVCSDPLMKILLDKQQLALKLTCNAVYGFTGTSKGMFPCLAVAESVTAQGRKLLSTTKDYICDTFNDWDALAAVSPAAFGDCRVDPDGFQVDVVYGDTDSVFVAVFGLPDTDVLCAALPDIAAHITRTLFPPPIKLEVDKVFTKLLLLCKKRYVGVLYGENKLSMKGIDLVRRNVCEFVKNTTLSVINSMFSDDRIAEAVQTLSRMTENDVKQRGIPPGFFNLVALITDARERLYENRVDMKDLLLSATLSQACDKYKQTNLPHLTVVKKKLDRKEDVPNTGDRVFYVLVAHPDDRVPNYVIAEDPEYARNNNLEINYKKYFTALVSSITHSISPIFPPFVTKHERFLAACIPRKTYPRPLP